MKVCLNNCSVWFCVHANAGVFNVYHEKIIYPICVILNRLVWFAENILSDVGNPLTLCKRIQCTLQVCA